MLAAGRDRAYHASPNNVSRETPRLKNGGPKAQIPPGIAQAKGPRDCEPLRKGKRSNLESVGASRPPKG